MNRRTSIEAEYFSPVRVCNLYSKQASHLKKRPSKDVEAYPARNGTGSLRKVFRLKIVYNDGGITIDVGSNQTMTHVMEIVCTKWLNILRNGDGSSDDHLWMVRGPPLTKSSYIKLDRCGDRRTMEWRDAHEICEKSKQTIRDYEKLKSIQGLDEDKPLSVVYGITRSTKFEIKLVHKYYIPKRGNRLPRLVPSVADKFAQSRRLHNPPEFCPNLNDIFPLANKAMFRRGMRWVCPYPTSPTNGGFICGEFQRRYDVLFLPYKSSCLFEALVIIESTLRRYPERGDESNSRIGLPVSLSFAREDKYNAYMREPSCEKRVNDLIPNKKFKEFLDPHNKVVSRIDRSELRDYDNVMDCMFPLCSRHYGNGLWASYRNRKVVIGKGNDRSGEERGVPRYIYAEVSHKVKSLHEFFCVCVSLFQRAESMKSTELERLFGKLHV